MRTVFLSYAFPPLQYPRAIQVARLATHLEGRRIEVYFGDEGAPGDLSPLAGMDPSRVAEHGVPVRSRPGSELRRRVLRGRPYLPDGQRAWARRAARTILAEQQLDEPDDVLVTFGQPMSDHLAGRWLKRRTGVRWIAHFSDPWVDNPLRPLFGPERWVNRRLETQVMQDADLLVFTSQQTIDLVLRGNRAPFRQKARVLPHAFDPALYGDAPVARGGRIVVRYLGGFYGRRTPAPLIAALEILARTDAGLLEDVVVEFIGSMPARIAAAVRGSALPDGLVRILPRVDYRASLEAMSEADVLLIIDAPADESVFLPSKLIDYVGARRPLLGITPPGAAADLLERLGAPVVHPEDTGGAADALRALLLAARSERQTGPFGAPEVVAAYEASTVARAFEQMIQGLRGSAAS